jgi:hypothetical protein
MLNQFHVHLNNHGILKKIEYHLHIVIRKHFIIVQHRIHSNYRIIIDVKRIEVRGDFRREKKRFFVWIDVRVTCLARFTDGNINYIVARSNDRQRFVCFVSFIYRKTNKIYECFHLVLYQNKTWWTTNPTVWNLFICWWYL